MADSSLTHKFISALADGSDSSQVQPTNWNDSHKITAPDGISTNQQGVLLGTESSGELALNGIVGSGALKYLRRNSGDTAYEFGILPTLPADGIIQTVGTTPSALSGTASQYLRRNSGNTAYEFGSLPSSYFVNIQDYNFTPVGSVGAVPLTIGVNSITLANVPPGVNGTDVGHRIYISGGTGTAEVVVIIGGTAVSGGTNQTLFFTCANTHSGAWTISSATAGIQEAINYAGGSKNYFFPAGSYLLRSKVTVRVNNVTFFGLDRNTVSLTTPNASGIHVFFDCTSGQNNLTFSELGFNGNFINQTYTASTVNGAISGSNCSNIRVLRCKFAAFGYSSASTGAQFAQILSFYSAKYVSIEDCYFESNFSIEGNFNGCSFVRVINNVLGSPLIADSNANVNYWDNKSGGCGFFFIGTADVYAAGNRMYGNHRGYDLATDTVYQNGTFLGSYNIDGTSSSDHDFINNFFNGLGNGVGVVSGTSGSGTLTGTNTQFHSLHVGTTLVLEGVATFYKITARASNTSITVTPVLGANAAGLKYHTTYSGDVITINNVTRFNVSGNRVLYSGDNSYDIGTSTNGRSEDGIFDSNYSEYCMTDGLFLGSATLVNVKISNNTFRNGQQATTSGYTGAIHIVQSAAYVLWNLCFRNNYFEDDQAVTTQLCGFDFEGDLTKIQGASEAGSHFFGYASVLTLHDTTTTDTQWGKMFSKSQTSGIIRQCPIAFADLANIDAIVNGMIVYCLDAKSISDGVAAGSTAVGAGTGALLVRQNSLWKVGF